MKNGVEYSKSKNYRIVKNKSNCYHIEHAEHRIEATTWVSVPLACYVYLAQARSKMAKLEEGICPQ